MSELQTQCWICPNCCDDHARDIKCPQYIKYRDALHIVAQLNQTRGYPTGPEWIVLMRQISEIMKGDEKT